MRVDPLVQKKLGPVRATASSLCLAGFLAWSPFAWAVESSGTELSPSTTSNMSATSQARSSDQSKRMAEAKQRFDRGLALYEDGDPGLALIEFSRAYQLIPNYRVLYNIGQVGIQLGRYANARRVLERYLLEAGSSLPSERREEVARDLTMLAGRTALLTVRSSVAGAEILVDDVVMGKTPLAEPLLVDAGVHRVRLRRPGYDAQTQRIALAGGDNRDLSPSLRQRVTSAPVIVMQDAPNQEIRRRNLMVVGWIAAGALTAGAVTTGIMGWGELQEHRELRNSRAEDVENLRERLSNTEANSRGLFLTADVLAVSALIAGGVSLWITVKSDDSSSPEDTALFQPSDLRLGLSPGQFLLRGAF